MSNHEFVYFDTSWMSPPGGTIDEVLEDRGMTQEERREYLDLTQEEYSAFLRGMYQAGDHIFDQMERMIPGLRYFWENRENDYWEWARLQGKLRGWCRKCGGPISHDGDCFSCRES